MSPLPKGLHVLKNGYLQLRIFSGGIPYHKNFGKDCSYARELAKIHLAEKRKEILNGKFGVMNHETKIFAEVAEIFFKRWSEERDASGSVLRSPSNTFRARKMLNRSLLPFFGKKPYQTIAPRDIEKWRAERLREVSGTSVNREQNLLSSIFSFIQRAIELRRIAIFAVPDKNPCRSVDRAKLVKRERVATPYEISKLKLAAQDLGDFIGRENICLALKTALSDTDLKRLKFGDTIDTKRSKTGVRVQIPMTVMFHPDWKNWQKRWQLIRDKAGCQDLQWRDLRKTAGNLFRTLPDATLKDTKDFMGHASEKTTEEFYMQADQERMAVLAKKLAEKIDSL